MANMKSYNNMDNISNTDFERMDSFFEEWLPAHSEVWLLGAGGHAAAWRHYMSQCGVAVNGFVVTAPMQPAAMTGEPIISINDFKTRYRRGSTGLVLTVDSDYYDELLPKLMFAFDDVFILKERYKRFAYNHKSRWADGKFEFTFAIVDHCNLACYSCVTASPVANGGFYDYKQFEAELLQMKKLFGDGLNTLWIGGGEPLLHPRLLDLLRLARKVLQTGGQMGIQKDIKLMTNGILMNKLGDDYYKCFADADVTICWTKYPLKYSDLENVFKRFRQFGVKYTYSEDTIDSPKKSAWMGIAEQAAQKRWDYLFCQMHNSCVLCKDGKIYHCHARMAADNICAGFDVAIPTRDAGLDIFGVKSADEILAYLSNRPALCDYCPLRDRRIVGDWRPSKKERGEWLL